MILTTAQIFAQHTGYKVEFFWPWQWPDCGCRIEDLVEGFSSLSEDVQPTAPGLYLTQMENPVELIENQLARGEDVTYCTWQAELCPRNMAEDIFKEKWHEACARLRPIDAILKKVPAVPEGTIGIQIRRQDHWRNIRHSPLTLFLRIMDRHCEENPQVVFLLATDSDTIGPSLRRRYGASRLIQLEKFEHRDSTAGVQAGLADILALSKTERIYQSFSSNFGFFAHLISKHPHFWVQRRKAPSHYNGCPYDRRHDQLMTWNQAQLIWERKPLQPFSLMSWIERWRYLIWTRWVTSDFYQRSPFHFSNWN